VTLETLLGTLRAAAEPTRFRILALCAQGELTVSELTRILGQSQPRVSRHLKLLTDAGLLDRFPEGSWVFHRLAAAEPAARVRAMLPDHDPLLAADRDRLAAVRRDRATAAARYFAKNARRWHQIRSLHVDEAEVEAVLVDLVAPSAAGDLLDVGTGTGRILEIFGPGARSAVGIDSSHHMLTVARANLARAGLEGCTVRQADMYGLPFAAASFDSVTIHQVLHYADEPARAVAEAARVLRPAGRVLVVDFAPHGIEVLRTEHSHRRLGFADAEVTGWFAAAGLETADVVHLAGDPLTVTVWLGRREDAGP
jgi:ArsR family transcriptional regulator